MSGAVGQGLLGTGVAGHLTGAASLEFRVTVGVEVMSRPERTGTWAFASRPQETLPERLARPKLAYIESAVQNTQYFCRIRR